MVTPRNCFSHGGVMAGETLHGQQLFAVSGTDIDAAVGPGIVGVVAGYIPTEPGEDRGQSHHIGIGISGDRVSRFRPASAMPSSLSCQRPMVNNCITSRA